MLIKPNLSYNIDKIFPLNSRRAERIHTKRRVRQDYLSQADFRRLTVGKRNERRQRLCVLSALFSPLFPGGLLPGCSSEQPSGISVSLINTLRPASETSSCSAPHAVNDSIAAVSAQSDQTVFFKTYSPFLLFTYLL